MDTHGQSEGSRPSFKRSRTSISINCAGGSILSTSRARGSILRTNVIHGRIAHTAELRNTKCDFNNLISQHLQDIWAYGFRLDMNNKTL
jgi:hypothetical protein